MDNAKNFSKVTLSTGYDNVATTVVLITSDGAKLPTAPFNVVWFNSTDYTDPTDDPNKEIVRVTNVTTDTLTITRAQEGTSAATHNTGGKSYKMIAGLTAKVINTDLPAMSITGSSASCTGNAATATNAFGCTLDTDGTLAANSDTKIPSQKAVKTYVDGKKAAGSDVTTGTDDVKYTTSKALADAGVNTRLKSKIIVASRDLSAAGAPTDVAYTGVGFIPTAIICIAVLTNGRTSIGMADSAKTNKIAELDFSNTWFTNDASGLNTDCLIYYAISGGNNQRAIVKTYDSDGFTLTWTKNGSPIGTLQLIFLCFR